MGSSNCHASTWAASCFAATQVLFTLQAGVLRACRSGRAPFAGLSPPTVALTPPPQRSAPAPGTPRKPRHAATKDVVSPEAARAALTHAAALCSTITITGIERLSVDEHHGIMLVRAGTRGR